MSKQVLTEMEIDAVSGGVLPTQYVTQSVQLKQMQSITLGSGNLKSTCQCVNCCSNHNSIEDVIINPLR